MIFASHAKGRGFNSLTAHTHQSELTTRNFDGAFALVHGHLLNFTPLLELSGLGGVFFCPSSVPPSRAISTPGQVINQEPYRACSGDDKGGDL